MTIVNSGFREIYSQDSDFVFNFRVSDYNSHDFSAGLYKITNSGDSFFGINCKSGLIYDWLNNLVSTYNGKPILFESSMRSGYAEYSLNGTPILRNSLVSADFNKIGVVTRDSGSLEFSSFLYGEKPTVQFNTAFSNSGVSGNFYNLGSYPIKLFNLYSNDYTGIWNFSTEVSPGGTGNYNISGANTWISGQQIQIFVDANYGNVDYLVNVDSESFPSGSSEDYAFASLALASGNNRIVETQEEFLYELPYLTSSAYLNLYFDYTQNRTGDALVFESGNFTGQYSGWLNAISGFCSGLLYSSSPSTSPSYYVLDAYNAQNVNFSSPTSVTHSAYATGRYIHTYNYYEDLVNGLDVPRPWAVIPSGYYLGDLGGYWGNTLVPNNVSGGDLHDLWLEKSIYTGDRSLTGTISSQLQSGKYVFNIESYQATGLFIKKQAIGTGLTGQSFEGRLYRGIAYCFLPDSYSFNVTGNVPIFGGYVITGTINSTYNCLLFKDVPNFSGAGQYVFSGLISGRILDKELGYYLRNGSFGLSEPPSHGFGNEGFQIHRHYMVQGMYNYDITRLNPFSGISNYLSDLYAGPIDDVDEYIPTGSQINFNGPGFIAHPAKMPNNLYYNNNLRYGAVGNYVQPNYVRSVVTDFTGFLPTPITGYIQRGDFRHYIATGALQGLFFEEPLEEYYLPVDQSQKTNINQLKTYTFNGEDTTLEVRRHIMVTGSTLVTQQLSPPFTGVLESGYFNTTKTSGVLRSGTFSGFAKNMPDIWKVYVGDEIAGPYIEMSVPPFIFSDSRYRMENIPIEGDSQKYIRITYSGASYNDISGNGDQGELTFTLTSYSGTQVIST